MKNTNIKVITAAAVMAAIMLTGCGNVIINNPETPEPAQAAAINATPAVAEAKTVEMLQADIKAPEIKPVQPPKSETSSKADDSSKASQPVKTETVKVVEEAKAQPTTVIVKVEDNRKTETAKAPETAQPVKQAETKKDDTKKAGPAKTAAPAAPVKVKSGTYYEQYEGTATMEITDNGNDTYAVHIAWPVNSNEVNAWDLTAYDNGKGALEYKNCVKTTYAFDANGNYCKGVDGIQTPFTVYSAGSGTFEVKNNSISWNDNMGDIFKGTTFAETKNTKAADKKDTKSANSTADKANTTNQTNTDRVDNNSIVTGSFYDVNGSRVRLNITKQDDGTYPCEVIMSEGYNSCIVYTFTCFVNGSALEYDYCYVNKIVYDDQGNANFTTISEGSSGSLVRSSEGIFWANSDGTQDVFTNEYI